MKLFLLGLCHIASIWAKPDGVIAAKKVQVIPPGYTTMNLVNGNTFFLLSGQSFVGNNSQLLNFTFNSRYPNILFGGPNYTVSGSYVDQGLVVPVTVPNSSFNLFTNPANVSREWFTLASAPNVAQIRGQIGGYVQNGTAFGPNTMGFQLNHSIFLNDAFFLDTAFQQAYISKKVISFAVNFSNINNPGQAYIGALNPSNFTTYPTNFSVDVNTGEWSMYLANMGTVSTDWGYNGYLTWDTSSPVNVVPRSVQRLMLQYLNVSSVTFGTVGNLTVAIIPCQPGGSYPYLYYTLSGNKQLTFSVDQYLIPFNSTAGTCVFTFATSNGGAPYGRAPYTIGSYAFHNAYTSFDFENRWVGRTELLPQS